MIGGRVGLAVPALFLSGCLVLPVPERTPANSVWRGAIRADDVEALHQERASREDVLLRLGEPDLVEDGGRRFTYAWKVVGAEIVWLDGTSRAVVDTRRLSLEFDESGHLMPARESSHP